MVMKRQTTTQAMGARIAAWIKAAGTWVIVRAFGHEVGLIAIDGLTAILDGGIRIALKDCRIYRSTIAQVKAMM